MITKDINGNTLPANYDSLVATPPRDWSVRIKSDGVLLDCAIASLEITKGSCGSSESFSIGNVYSNMLNAQLMELNTNIKGTDLEVQIALGTTWITVGKFVAIEVKKTAYVTSVTGYGFSTAKSSGAFAIPQVLSLSNIASAIGTAMGCTVSFGSGINPAYQIYGTLESGMSCYSGLQLLAHLCGGYARDTNDGNVIIEKFSNTPTMSVSVDSMRQLPDVEELPFTVTGVKVVVVEADLEADPPVPEVSYSYGSPIIIYDENPNMSADIFNNIYKGIVGYSYKTGSVDLSLGDPRIEGDDVLSVTDVNGNVYIVPCHLVKHKYDGGLSTSIQAVKAPSDSEGMATGTPISQRIDGIASSAEIAKSYAEIAKASAEEAQRIVGELEEDVDNLNTRVSTAEGKVTTLEGDITNLEDRVSTAESDITTVEGDISTLQTRVSDAEEDVDATLRELAVAQDVVGTINWITNHGTMTSQAGQTFDSNQVYFVVDPNGDYLVGGTRYAVVPEPVASDINNYYVLSISESVQNYVATHIVVDSEGLWIIPDGGGNKVLIATGQGTGYPSAGTYIVNGSAVLASFTADGAQIGQTGESHLEMDYHSMKLVDKEGNEYFYVSDLRDKNDGYQAIIKERYIGDGEQQSFPVSLPVSDEVSATDSSHSWNPASRNDQLYTFAQAPSNGATVIITYKTTSVYAKSWILGLGYLSESGPLSVSEGTGIARGYCSHSEGSGLTEGVHSHAEGATTKALGDCSHAEGDGCTAEAFAAHAEGWGTRANGRYSHAQNINTEANYEAQTVIGKYNDNKSDTAFEIGNGKLNSGTEDRSNSHDFTWDGNIRLAFDTTATTGTDKEIYDALVSLGWDSDVIV